MAGTTLDTVPGAYDEFAYPGYVYPQTYPGRLEVLGRLFGLEPAPAASCRVLELGCGDGGNCLAIAQALPGATVIGVDAAQSAIERGQALAAAAGLSNAELRVGDLSDPALPEQLGQIDYVIAHGVFSWVPPHVRGALLDLAKSVLAPHGIAYISYNAYPGSHLRDMTGDILDYHLAVHGATTAAERLARAQELMRTIVAIEDPSPYARVLREHLERMLAESDALLLHDDLAEVSTPFYFHEFNDLASRRGLQYLSEAELSASQMRDVPDAVAELMNRLPPDVVVREQYLDFFRNRMFRQTLLVQDDVPVSRRLDSSALERFWIASPAELVDGSYRTQGGSVQTTDAVLVAALEQLIVHWPQWVSFAELAQRLGVADARREQLRVELLELHLVHVAQLSGASTALARQPGSQPLASPLARAQAAAGRPVLTTLHPSNYTPADEDEHRLIPLLDGKRTAAQLASESGSDAEAVTARLEHLARHGLLQPATSPSSSNARSASS